MCPIKQVFVALLLILWPATAVLEAQEVFHNDSVIILPPRRVIHPIREQSIRIEAIKADVSIRNHVATTTVEVTLYNPSHRRREGQVLLPVPDGAGIRSLGLGKEDKALAGRILPRDEARRIYEQIVASMKDPALLEFVGYNMVRSSVFPIEPRSKQQFRMTYEHLLPSDTFRYDYFLPRSQALDYTVPWSIRLDIQSRDPINTTYCPSHDVTTIRHTPNHITIELADTARRTPGPFRVSYVAPPDKVNGMATSLLACPDADGGVGGYFLLLGGLPSIPDADRITVKREVTLVIDRSGSMAGDQIKQAKAAAKQLVAGLNPGETFNIITYSDTIEVFAGQPVAKNDQSMQDAWEYIDSIIARGGTNIHDALLEALRPKPQDDALPIVLFLTDGLPTVGQTSEAAIRDVPARFNAHERRIFTIGVGADVNTPLLERIADVSRGKATFVLPGEDVEAKVGSVFRKLQGPIFTDIRLNVRGKAANARAFITDLLPTRISDLFDGDQLILMGRYKSSDVPVGFDITGKFLGDQRTFTAQLDPGKASFTNSYIPRLWATRKIGVLIDSIRQMGADPNRKPNMNDPRIKELVDEIVKLSIQFGIMTEYTAFLADERTEIASAASPALRGLVAGELDRQAISERSGLSALSQSSNSVGRKSAYKLNVRNEYMGRDLKRKSVEGVQMVDDMTMYRRENRWVYISKEAKLEDLSDVTRVSVGSEAYWQLADRLVKQNRSAVLALDGEILLEEGGNRYLIVPK